jgi:hypothetical protein
MCIRYTAARLEVARAVPVPALTGPPHPGRRGHLGARPDPLQRRPAQPRHPHRIGPGTIKDVAVTLVPTAAASPGAGSAGAVDNAASSSAGSATLPLRGAEPGAGLVKAASATGAGSVKAAPAIGAGSVKAGPAAAAQLLSAPVAVGKARFVGVSWPASAVGAAGQPGGQGLAACPDGCRLVGLAGGRAGCRRGRRQHRRVPAVGAGLQRRALAGRRHGPGADPGRPAVPVRRPGRGRFRLRGWGRLWHPEPGPSSTSAPSGTAAPPGPRCRRPGCGRISSRRI